MARTASSAAITSPLPQRTVTPWPWVVSSRTGSSSRGVFAPTAAYRWRGPATVRVRVSGGGGRRRGRAWVGGGGCVATDAPRAGGRVGRRVPAPHDRKVCGARLTAVRGGLRRGRPEFWAVLAVRRWDAH